MSDTADQATAEPAEPDIPPGAVEVGGRIYLPDARGKLVPIELVKAADRLEDEVVRTIMSHAEELNAQIARFRGHTVDDLGGLTALLDQEYGVTKGGPRGNATFTTFDGLMKVQVQRADLIEFGPQLQSAKQLIDEYLNELTADARPELRAVVTRAFDTDKEGQINRAELFRLRRLDIDDERWRNAMQAIADAVRVVGSKEYVRFYRRERPQGRWQAVTIDLASA